jgi:hypothetical protein
LALFVGIKFILAPLKLLGAFIPFFEDIAGAASSLIAAVMSIVMFCWAVFLIWIVFRPLWAELIALSGNRLSLWVVATALQDKSPKAALNTAAFKTT